MEPVSRVENPMQEATKMQPMADQPLTLESGSWGRPLEESFTDKLAKILPDYVAGRRWFRAKTRTIRCIEIEDAFAIEGSEAHLLILKIGYADGGAEEYILPVAMAAGEGQERVEIIARLIFQNGEAGIVYSALEDETFRTALLNAIVRQIGIEGRNGMLIASCTSALSERSGAAAMSKLTSFVSKAEQSNSSIIYDNRYILKLFRKLEAGINPDVEIGQFLTEHRFAHTPAALGSLEYRDKRDEEVRAAGILQQFVPNRGDAWKFTLDCLGESFAKALARKRPPPERWTEHPLGLIGQEIPSEVRSFIGTYLESAALLGKRTAEMHTVLADQNGGPDFKPESFTAADGNRLHTDLIGQADMAFELLRRKQAVLTGRVAERARELLRIEHSVTERFTAIRDHPVSAMRIRHHGDYHLGQVLYSGHDFMIIDFEGEPARALTERRAKALAMRDVAGMIRSFQYAAFAALFGQVPGVPSEPEAASLVETWAAAWNAYVSSTFLRAYFEQARDQLFVPAGWQERRILLDAFLLQKALYEVAYELNNRPDWLAIPLRGILTLIG